MTRQKSDGRIVPDGRRKAVGTRGIESRAGGKATTVKQQGRQLQLVFGTAENMLVKASVPVGITVASELATGALAGPKPKDKEKTSIPTTMMDRVVASLDAALTQVSPLCRTSPNGLVRYS